VTVLEQFGYPAGMPREMSVPLAGLPAGTTALRLSTTLEVYWDRLRVVWAEPCPEARAVVLAVSEATLSETGFPLRTTGPQRQPSYDDSRRAGLWDTRDLRGWYTAFGDVRDLVSGSDDALAIFGPGEGVRLAFDAAGLPPVAAGWARRFVLRSSGWCKDMDLYTRTGDSLEPIPSRDPDPTSRDQARDQRRTRYQYWRP
jgi:hypothetical protein